MVLKKLRQKIFGKRLKKGELENMFTELKMDLKEDHQELKQGHEKILSDLPKGARIKKLIDQLKEELEAESGKKVKSKSGKAKRKYETEAKYMAKGRQKMKQKMKKQLEDWSMEALDNAILQAVKKIEGGGNHPFYGRIKEKVVDQQDLCSEPTLVNHMKDLVKQDYLEKQKKGRRVIYNSNWQ